MRGREKEVTHNTGVQSRVTSGRDTRITCQGQLSRETTNPLCENFQNVRTPSDKFKARLFVQGRRESNKSLLIHDIDTLRHASLRTVWSIAPSYKMYVWAFISINGTSAFSPPLSWYMSVQIPPSAYHQTSSSKSNALWIY